MTSNRKITLQLRADDGMWQDVATLTFNGRADAEIEYDLDYAAKHFGQADGRALSLCYPVNTQIYRGALPGFLLDLVPQGEPLKRLLARYGINDSSDWYEILATIPLAPPGNIRVKEAWIDLDKVRDTYNHKGFDLADIIKHSTEFISYMEIHGAPIGGTSGAGGGSPKFLLRQDQAGKYHAEGMLKDRNTAKAYLIKFPYTDSQNSRSLNETEKSYYDLLRQLPVKAGDPIEIHDGILFISRFDRVPTPDRKMRYYGLESLYSAHNINIHGTPLTHEDNLALIHRMSTDPASDLIEYLKRDILNKMLANTDNHGRNTSFIKSADSVNLSPIYDITAMRFFAGDFIVELTRWGNQHQTIRTQVQWMSKAFKLPEGLITDELRKLHKALGNLELKLHELGINPDFIARSHADRNQTFADLEAAIT